MTYNVFSGTLNPTHLTSPPPPLFARIALIHFHNATKSALVFFTFVLFCRLASLYGTDTVWVTLLQIFLLPASICWQLLGSWRRCYSSQQCYVHCLRTIINLHRTTTYVDVAYCYRWSSVVCRSVCHNGEPCKIAWTHRHATWVVDLGGSKEALLDVGHVGAAW